MCWSPRFAVYLVGVTRLEHGRVAARQLTEQFDNALANQAAPIGGRIDEGTPVAILSIPRFGVHETVVEGTSGTQLKQGSRAPPVVTAAAPERQCSRRVPAR